MLTGFLFNLYIWLFFIVGIFYSYVLLFKRKMPAEDRAVIALCIVNYFSLFFLILGAVYWWHSPPGIPWNLYQFKVYWYHIGMLLITPPLIYKLMKIDDVDLSTKLTVVATLVFFILWGLSLRDISKIGFPC